MAVEFKKDITLAEIKVMAEELLKKADAAETAKERAEIEADLDEVITEYAKISKQAVYNAAKASGDPMKYAIMEFWYPAIRVKEDKETDAEGKTIITRSIADTSKPIDLGDMHKRLEGIGANKQWIYAAEKFNFYLTKRAADRVGAKINSDAFALNEICKQIEMGKTPCSNTNLLKTLQQVVTMMLGDGYKATSHDVNYLIDVYATDAKKSKTAITLANHKTLRGYLKKVCYRILTNGRGYDVEQREIKTVSTPAAPAEKAEEKKPAKKSEKPAK